MENSGGIQASLAGRYATALFGLARDKNQIDAVIRSVATLESAMAESADFKALVTSPLIGRDDAERTIEALAPALSLDPLTGNFLGVLAENGRLAELKAILKLVKQLAAAHRGETHAEVTSAMPLDDTQIAALKAKLAKRAGRDVNLDVKVDPSLLGGIVVKLGSQMIDASIKTKLNTLANAMKG